MLCHNHPSALSTAPSKNWCCFRQAHASTLCAPLEPLDSAVGIALETAHDVAVDIPFDIALEPLKIALGLAVEIALGTAAEITFDIALGRSMSRPDKRAAKPSYRSPETAQGKVKPATITQ